MPLFKQAMLLIINARAMKEAVDYSLLFYMAHWHNNVLCILLIQDKQTSDSPLSNSQLCATVLSWVSLIVLRLNI